MLSLRVRPGSPVLVLALIGVLLRSLLPEGYMPAAIGGGGWLGLCPAYAPIPQGWSSGVAGHHHHHHDGGGPSARQQSCPLKVLLGGAALPMQHTPAVVVRVVGPERPPAIAAQRSQSFLTAYRPRGPPLRSPA